MIARLSRSLAEPQSGWWFTRILGDLRGRLSRGAPTRVDPRWEHLIGYAVAAIAPEVFESSSRQDLRRRLELLANSPSFLAIRVLLESDARRIEPDFSEGTFTVPAAERVADAITEALGEGVAADAQHIARLVVAHLSAVRALLRDPDARQLPSVADVEAMYSQANRISTPPSLRRALQGALISDVCLLAIVGLLHAGADDAAPALDPWLRRGIAEELRASLVELLRLVALLDGSLVPTSVLPEEERLIAAELAADAARVETVMEPAFARALAGEPAIHPFGEPLLDD